MKLALVPLVGWVSSSQLYFTVTVIVSVASAASWVLGLVAVTEIGVVVPVKPFEITWPPTNLAFKFPVFLTSIVQTTTSPGVYNFTAKVAPVTEFLVIVPVGSCWPTLVPVQVPVSTYSTAKLPVALIVPLTVKVVLNAA